MRRNTIMLLILLLAAVLYFFTMRTGPEQVPSGSQLSQAMASVNAIPKEAVLEARCQVATGKWPEGQVQAELEQLAWALMIPAVIGETESWITGSHDEMNFYPAKAVSYEIRDENREVDLKLHYNRRNRLEPGLLTISVTLKELSMLPDFESHWQQVLESRGYKPKLSTLLTGTFNGPQIYNEGEALMAGVFQALAVEEPWQQQDHNWVSWGGYSPRISAPLLDARGAPINVQAALRYHHLEDRTYLYLGSPLIYREF